MCFLVLVAKDLSVFLFQVQNNFNIFYFALLESAIRKEQEMHIQLGCHLFILVLILYNKQHPFTQICRETVLYQRRI